MIVYGLVLLFCVCVFVCLFECGCVCVIHCVMLYGLFLRRVWCLCVLCVVFKLVAPCL